MEKIIGSLIIALFALSVWVEYDHKKKSRALFAFYMSEKPKRKWWQFWKG